MIFSNEMLEIATKLSKPFPMVRVDLYEYEGKVKFGELTFYHFGGNTPFKPDEWDLKFGSYFNLEESKKIIVILGKFIIQLLLGNNKYRGLQNDFSNNECLQ